MSETTRHAHTKLTEEVGDEGGGVVTPGTPGTTVGRATGTRMVGGPSESENCGSGEPRRSTDSADGIRA